MVYHGAMCFCHLLGLRLAIIVVAVTTCACTAYSMRNYSIYCALRSLSCSYFYSISLKAVAKASVDVWARHFYALILYSFMCSPVIHLYFILLLFRTGSFDGGAWWLGGAVMRSAAVDGGLTFTAIMGMVVVSRS